MLKTTPALIFVTWLCAAACSSDDGTSNQPPQPVTPPAATITMHNMTFEASTVTVQTGQDVMWMNTDSITHTVTSGTGSTDAAAGALFDRVLNPGESFSYHISQKTSIEYFCRLHEAMGMKGTIVVTAPPPPPPPGY